MRNTVALFTLPIIYGLLIGCNNNDNQNECIKSQTEFITSVISPSIGEVHQTIDIELRFRLSNSCGDFEKFIETNNGNTRMIEIEARYVSCICTLEIPPVETIIYKFTPESPGEYELNFKSSTNEFITANLTIN